MYMKTALLAILAAACLSSCTVDSISYGTGVNGVSYPTHRIVVPPVYHTGHTTYHYDLRPDYVRYGSHCRSVRYGSYCAPIGRSRPALRRNCHR